MYHNPRRLRRPEERVGTFTNAALPPPAATMSAADRLLQQRLRARDNETFQQLYDSHYAWMLHTAREYVRSREEAEEVVQETWLAVFSRIDEFQGRSSFKTWLYRILTNRARTRGKREARVIPFSSLPAGDPQAVAPASGKAPPSPEQHVLDLELAEFLERSMATLPTTQRAVLSLRDIEGWSAAEVCAAMRITPGNQRLLLHRARSQVRKKLSPYVRAGSGV